MADLWVLVPSRGRPGSVERLVRACALTCRADTRLHFAFDDDDEHLAANITAAAGHRYTVGPRDGLAGWTNDLAARHVKRGDAAALASIGDDHLPVTDGWDAKLLAALPAGGGFAYPDDQRRVDIPEAVVISAPIVAGLGWMCPVDEAGRPLMKHWHIDQVWADLGRGTDSLVFCRDVIVRHLHPNVAPREARPDQTYTDAAGDWDADMRAYARWRIRAAGMRADIAAVERVRAAQAAAV